MACCMLWGLCETILAGARGIAAAFRDEKGCTSWSEPPYWYFVSLLYNWHSLSFLILAWVGLSSFSSCSVFGDWTIAVAVRRHHQNSGRCSRLSNWSKIVETRACRRSCFVGVQKDSTVCILVDGTNVQKGIVWHGLDNSSYWALQVFATNVLGPDELASEISEA